MSHYTVLLIVVFVGLVHSETTEQYVKRTLCYELERDREIPRRWRDWAISYVNSQNPIRANDVQFIQDQLKQFISSTILRMTFDEMIDLLRSAHTRPSQGRDGRPGTPGVVITTDSQGRRRIIANNGDIHIDGQGNVRISGASGRSGGHGQDADGLYPPYQPDSGYDTRGHDTGYDPNYDQGQSHGGTGGTRIIGGTPGRPGTPGDSGWSWSRKRRDTVRQRPRNYFYQVPWTREQWAAFWEDVSASLGRGGDSDGRNDGNQGGEGQGAGDGLSTPLPTSAPHPTDVRNATLTNGTLGEDGVNATSSVNVTTPSPDVWTHENRGQDGTPGKDGVNGGVGSPGQDGAPGCSVVVLEGGRIHDTPRGCFKMSTTQNTDGKAYGEYYYGP